AGAAQVVAVVARGVEGGRTGTDRAHVAKHHVDQVGQLVEAGLAQRATDRRHARVVLDLEIDRVGAVLVQVAQGLLERLGVDHHGAEDRKSTRLNSSHVKISYAVFCVKKKKTGACRTRRRRAWRT